MRRCVALGCPKGGARSFGAFLPCLAAGIACCAREAVGVPEGQDSARAAGRTGPWPVRLELGFRSGVAAAHVTDGVDERVGGVVKFFVVGDVVGAGGVSHCVISAASANGSCGAQPDIPGALTVFAATCARVAPWRKHRRLVLLSIGRR